MTRYGGWDDPRSEGRERAAGERWYGERGEERWREPREERDWGERRDWPETPRRYGSRWGDERREEIDPPWVERGPYARRTSDSRGLVEWEDRGPLQWLGAKFREATGRGKRGPKGYRRSDDRIVDEVCERIARSPVDATDVEVEVERGEVTLTGTVRTRREKWWLEDMAEDVFGVEDVHNHLRVARSEGPGRAGDVPREPMQH